jgi:2-amino-4-hydroxy-6-hydroxymethyldihydropteridine diphosphokinase
VSTRAPDQDTRTTFRVVIGLGANLGDRQATMREAATRIASIEGVRIAARSRVYETAPVGGPPQPHFLNAAVLVESALSPPALLEELLRIEVALGRVRGAEEVRFGPRTLDLDVLWVEGVTLDEPRLVVPHPRLAARAFALMPMLEVAPGAVDPRTGEAFVVLDAGGVRVTSSTW